MSQVDHEEGMSGPPGGNTQLAVVAEIGIVISQSHPSRQLAELGAPLRHLKSSITQYGHKQALVPEDAVHQGSNVSDFVVQLGANTQDVVRVRGLSKPPEGTTNGVKDVDDAADRIIIAPTSAGVDDTVVGAKGINRVSLTVVLPLVEMETITV